MDWPTEPWFYIPEDVQEHFRQAVGRGAALESAWQKDITAYAEAFPQEAGDLTRRYAGSLPDGWEADLPVFPADEKGLATRASSGKVLDAVAPNLPELMGGSADLSPSNKTKFAGSQDFQADSPHGRYLRFGVREHAMGAIVNGLAYHGGFIPYGGTFLVFSDYMRPSVRLSALSGLGSIWVFTHDSIGLGEDGPTHQPVEHLAALRAIPNLTVIRPADANEVAQAWRVALKERHAPTALALSRQGVPTFDRQKYAGAEGLMHGAYVLADLGDGAPRLILLASGTEVELIVQAGEQLASQGVSVRLVSFPCWELFEVQDSTYKDSVLPPDVHKRLAVEAGVGQGWERWVGDAGQILSVETFGASAPYKEIYAHKGLTVENIVNLAKNL